MMKRIALFLIFSLFMLCLGAISIYFVNPFNVKTDNIRPRLFGFDIYQIPSKSMQPLLFPRDFIMVSNIAYAENLPKRSDVIVFYRPKPNESQINIPFIKRIIAVGGDTVQLQNGKLLVNNQPETQHYVDLSNNKTPYSLKMNTTIVPQNHVFVMGDNRDNSADSRIFGPVSNEAIIAKATSILYGSNDRSGTEIK